MPIWRRPPVLPPWQPQPLRKRLLNILLPQNSYSTSFPLTENPMSEGGVWLQGLADGLDWTNVRTTTNKAFGTESGSNTNTGIGVTPSQYDDATAVLKGSWGNDQFAQATVFNSQGAGGDWSSEVELRLRTTIGAHSITGYEIEYNCQPADSTGYFDIVRWNGQVADFTNLKHVTGIYLTTGDVVRATAVGNVITGYLNGSVIWQLTDSTFASGAPGVGFYLHNRTGTGDPTQYGFSAFSAGTLTPSFRDTVTRFRLASANVWRDTSTRFRLQSATTWRDTSTRFRLLANATRDTATRFRLQSVTTYRDTATRFKLQAAVTRDTATRFKLLAAATRDTVTRFRLQSVATWRDTATRFRLQAAATRDTATRYRLRATGFRDTAIRFNVQLANANWRDTATRFRLSSAAAFRDQVLRFRLQSATQYRDTKTRLRLAATGTRDTAIRFYLNVPGITFRDTALRFRLRSAATIRDTVTRYRLQVSGMRDTSARYRLAASHTRDTVIRFKLSVPGGPVLDARHAVSDSPLFSHTLTDIAA